MMRLRSSMENCVRNENRWKGECPSKQTAPKDERWPNRWDIRLNPRVCPTLSFLKEIHRVVCDNVRWQTRIVHDKPWTLL